jgi:hypothetical protein
MSQNDMVIADQNGVAFLADVNSALAALVSNSSGATEPSTTYAYQFWADTTTGILKQRNAANSSWIPLGPLADLGIQTGTQSLATVGGAADALTLSFTPALTALHGGIFQFVAAFDNATTTPTGNLNGLGAKTFIKGNNLALAAGDIKSGMTMLARYDSVLAKLALLNPATGVTAASGVVTLTGNQTIAGVKTFTSTPVVPAQSMVQLHTGNGYGSTNTKIRRFTTTVVNQGTDITYADSASLGASFTINVSGVYAISYTNSANGSSYSAAGISKDSTQLTTNISSCSAASVLQYAGTVNAETPIAVSWTGYLTAGSVIRPHDGGAAGTTLALFTIARVA